jgi:hypothetical protein
MKINNTFYFTALALCLVDIRRVSISNKPLICIDPDEKPNQHRHINGIEWTERAANGDYIRAGRVTLKGRVSVYSDNSDGTKQTALPFGGNWQSDAENAYQDYRWKGDFSQG